MRWKHLEKKNTNKLKWINREQSSSRTNIKHDEIWGCIRGSSAAQTLLWPVCCCAIIELDLSFILVQYRWPQHLHCFVLFVFWCCPEQEWEREIERETELYTLSVSLSLSLSHTQTQPHTLYLNLHQVVRRGAASCRNGGWCACESNKVVTLTLPGRVYIHEHIHSTNTHIHNTHTHTHTQICNIYIYKHIHTARLTAEVRGSTDAVDLG